MTDTTSARTPRAFHPPLAMAGSAGEGPPGSSPVHRPGCPGDRLEADELPDAYGRPVPRTRCLDCGASAYGPPGATTDQSEAARGLRAGDEAWRQLWYTDPKAVWRALSRTERRDPRLNPRHPFAEPAPPGKALQKGLR